MNKLCNAVRIVVYGSWFLMLVILLLIASPFLLLGAGLFSLGYDEEDLL